jgi:hypothetical protein
MSLTVRRDPAAQATAAFGCSRHSEVGHGLICRPTRRGRSAWPDSAGRALAPPEGNSAPRARANVRPVLHSFQAFPAQVTMAAQAR